MLTTVADLVVFRQGPGAYQWWEVVGKRGARYSLGNARLWAARQLLSRGASMADVVADLESMSLGHREAARLQEERYAADAEDGPNNGATQCVYLDGLVVASRVYSRQYAVLDGGWRGANHLEHWAAIAAQAGKPVASWEDAYRALT